MSINVFLMSCLIFDLTICFKLCCPAGATLLPFIPLIGRQMGVAAASIGIIYTVAQILTFVMKPVFGLMADRLKRRKVMLMLVIFLALIAGSSISFLPSGAPARPVTFECGKGTNYIKVREYSQNQLFKAIFMHPVASAWN